MCNSYNNLETSLCFFLFPAIASLIHLEFRIGTHAIVDSVNMVRTRNLALTQTRYWPTGFCGTVNRLCNDNEVKLGNVTTLFLRDFGISDRVHDSTPSFMTQPSPEKRKDNGLKNVMISTTGVQPNLFCPQ